MKTAHRSSPGRPPGPAPVSTDPDSLDPRARGCPWPKAPAALWLLLVVACTAPTETPPSFAAPQASQESESPVTVGASPATGASVEASAPRAVPDLPPEIKQQIRIAQAQRRRGELRDRLDSMPPEERDGPTGRKLAEVLQALEEEILTMGRGEPQPASQP